MRNRCGLLGLLAWVFIFLFSASFVKSQGNKETVNIYTFLAHVYLDYEKVEMFSHTQSIEKRQNNNQVVFQYTDDKNGSMVFELSLDTSTDDLWIIDKKDTLYLVSLERKEYIFVADDKSHIIYKYLSIGPSSGKSYLFFISEEFGYLMYRSIFNKWYVELSNHSADEDNMVNILISLIRNDKEFYYSR